MKAKGWLRGGEVPGLQDGFRGALEGKVDLAGHGPRVCCSGGRPGNATGRDAATLFSPRGWGSRAPCERKGRQKLGWRKGEPWRPDIQYESRGPKPVYTPLHLQAVQKANRESKHRHPHPEISHSWAGSTPLRPDFRTLLAKYLSRARG